MTTKTSKGPTAESSLSAVLFLSPHPPNHNTGNRPTATNITEIAINGNTVRPISDERRAELSRRQGAAVVVLDRSIVTLEELHDATRTASKTSGGFYDVWFGSDDPLIAAPPVSVAASFADRDQLHLGGLLWPEAGQRIANSAYLTRETKGHGQVILFAGEPVFRGATLGTSRLLLNAMVYGPGMGTSAIVTP